MPDFGIERIKYFFSQTLPEVKSKVESSIHSALQAIRHLPKKETSSTAPSNAKPLNVKQLNIPKETPIERTQKGTSTEGTPSSQVDASTQEGLLRSSELDQMVKDLEELDLGMTQTAAETTLVASAKLTSSFSPTGSLPQAKTDWSDNPEKAQIGDRVLINKNDPSSTGVVTNIFTDDETGKPVFWVEQENGVGDLYSPNDIGVVEKKGPSTTASLPFGAVKGGVSSEIRQSQIAIPSVNISITSQMSQVGSITQGQLTPTELKQLATFMESPEMKEAEMNAKKNPDGVYIQRDQFGKGQPPRSISICKEGDQIHHFVELKALGLSTTYQAAKPRVEFLKNEIAAIETSMAPQQARIDRIHAQVEQKNREITMTAGRIQQIEQNEIHIAFNTLMSTPSDAPNYSDLLAKYTNLRNELPAQKQHLQNLLQDVNQLALQAYQLDQPLQPQKTQVQGLKSQLADLKKEALKEQGVFLGEGTYKNVRRALQWDPETNTQRVIVSAKIKDREAFADALNESRLQKEYGSGLASARIAIGGKEKVLQFTELANMGDGDSVAKNSTWNRLSPENRKQICTGIFQNVRGFHAEGYLNRDIKPPNFLFNRDNEGNIEVITNDLGLSAKGVPTEMAGSPRYISPTVLYRRETQDQRDDTYQLGVTLWEFTHQNYVDQNGKEYEGSSCPSWIDSPCDQYLNGRIDGENALSLLTLNYNERKKEVDTNGADVEKIAMALMDPDPKTRMTLDTAEKLLSQMPESAFIGKLCYR